MPSSGNYAYSILYYGDRSLTGPRRASLCPLPQVNHDLPFRAAGGLALHHELLVEGVNLLIEFLLGLLQQVDHVGHHLCLVTQLRALRQAGRKQVLGVVLLHLLLRKRMSGPCFSRRSAVLARNPCNSLRLALRVLTRSLQADAGFGHTPT